MAEGYGWRAYRCPFHPDSDASGSVNADKQVFNCHAADCPKGNAVQVIMLAEGWSWSNKEDVERAKQRAADLSGQSVGDVRSPRSRSGRMAGGSRTKSGVRQEQRTWRRPGRSAGS